MRRSKQATTTAKCPPHACIHTPACFPRPVDVRRAHPPSITQQNHTACSLRLPTSSFVSKVTCCYFPANRFFLSFLDNGALPKFDRTSGTLVLLPMNQLLLPSC